MQLICSFIFNFVSDYQRDSLKAPLVPSVDYAFFINSILSLHPQLTSLSFLSIKVDLGGLVWHWMRLSLWKKKRRKSFSFTVEGVQWRCLYRLMNFILSLEGNSV